MGRGSYTPVRKTEAKPDPPRNRFYVEQKAFEARAHVRLEQ